MATFKVRQAKPDDVTEFWLEVDGEGDLLLKAANGADAHNILCIKQATGSLLRFHIPNGLGLHTDERRRLVVYP